MLNRKLTTMLGYHVIQQNCRVSKVVSSIHASHSTLLQGTEHCTWRNTVETPLWFDTSCSVLQTFTCQTDAVGEVMLDYTTLLFLKHLENEICILRGECHNIILNISIYLMYHPRSAKTLYMFVISVWSQSNFC